MEHKWIMLGYLAGFEIPMVARQLALTGQYNAIICLGAVIRGQTPHFDYVAGEVAKGVAAAGFQTGVPIVFGSSDNGLNATGSGTRWHQEQSWLELRYERP